MSLRHLAVLAALLLAACGGSTSPDGVGSSSGGGSSSSSGGGTADFTTQAVTFTASDGVPLRAFVSGAGDLRPRPLIVEFSPYAPTSFFAQFSAPAQFGKSFGPDYNYVEVNARGTGQSQGVWGAVGPNDQRDVAEFLAWACKQPWSNGHIGLYGFSASAIAIYNSMWQKLDCVEAASLMAGSDDLYRDLLYPGGIFNFAPATVVAFGVGGPLLASAPGNVGGGESLGEALRSMIGFLGLDVDILSHTTEDAYWQVRTQRRDPAGPNNFPVLADTSFYDPEPRGPFESFRLFRSLGTQVHLLAYGAHDGFPKGTLGPFPDFQRWYDHYLLGAGNGVDSDPAVQLLVGNGSRDALRNGAFTRITGNDWPLPGTRWQPLFLAAPRSGSAVSLNDGSLAAQAPAARSVAAYLDVPSLATATDPDSTSTIAVSGLGPWTVQSLFDALPLLTQLNTNEPLALTWTTPALKQDVDVVGPASLDLFLATLPPEDDIYAVLGDVGTDGKVNAVGVGRLRTGFPDIDRARSLIDANGEVVQPYGDYGAKQDALPGQTREYHVEFWPVGNHFSAGHRLRLYLLGTSLYMLPEVGVNLVSLGGATPSRLLLPVLPGSDIAAAMTQP